MDSLPGSVDLDPGLLIESDKSLVDVEKLAVAKACFDVKEYYRAAHFLKFCSSPKAIFLRSYSLYLVRNRIN